MALRTTVLFDRPHNAIAPLLLDRISRADAVSIVSGFATPAGLNRLAAAFDVKPQRLQTLVVGAATYPAFEALDELLGSRVPPDRLFVHLGHAAATGRVKSPFTKFRPMLHSKIYYMELPGGEACAVIGSHNITDFALSGLNGEASVLLEGAASEPEFRDIRAHIALARAKATQYDPTMKEAYASWAKDYFDGLSREFALPTEALGGRTIVIFAQEEAGRSKPMIGQSIYFEIPEGIQQIASLRTEVHLYLFDKVPSHPLQALDQSDLARAKIRCVLRGAENASGNLEVAAHWRIDRRYPPTLKRVDRDIYRPVRSEGMQQVRAEVEGLALDPVNYLFEREAKLWEPVLDPTDESIDRALVIQEGRRSSRTRERRAEELDRNWALVRGFELRGGTRREPDQLALERASPKSGEFILVALKTRRK